MMVTHREGSIYHEKNYVLRVVYQLTGSLSNGNGAYWQML